MFAIDSAQSFFAKVEDDLATLLEERSHSGKAMNCILSAYHLHDWVWAQLLEAAAPVSLNGRMIRTKRDFVKWLDDSCPYFKLLQELSRGTKHCTPVCRTGRIAGYGVGPYSAGPYGEPYLLIDNGPDQSPGNRYLIAHSVLVEVVEFWSAFFKQFVDAGADDDQPGSDLRPPL